LSLKVKATDLVNTSLTKLT